MLATLRVRGFPFASTCSRLFIACLRLLTFLTKSFQRSPANSSNRDVCLTRFSPFSLVRKVLSCFIFISGPQLCYSQSDNYGCHRTVFSRSFPVHSHNPDRAILHSISISVLRKNSFDRAFSSSSCHILCALPAFCFSSSGTDCLFSFIRHCILFAPSSAPSLNGSLVTVAKPAHAYFWEFTRWLRMSFLSPIQRTDAEAMSRWL